MDITFHDSIIKYEPELCHWILDHFYDFQEIIDNGDYEWYEGWNGKRYKSSFNVPRNPNGATASLFRSKTYDLLDNYGKDKLGCVGYHIDEELNRIYFFEAEGGC